MDRIACNSQSPISQNKTHLSSINDNKYKQELIPNAKQYNNRYNANRRRDNRNKWVSNSNDGENNGSRRARVRTAAGNVDNDSEWQSHSSENRSKKHNLNHLLNFSYPSREHDMREYHRNCGKLNQRAVKYNKEHFLQAICQFVVRKGFDYSVHLNDCDTPVDWNLVEEVRYNSASDQTVCPICLHCPIAAKITRCGHIYCWSCILHYLSLSDHKWRKCPICFDAIRSDELRSVSCISITEFKVADQITMCLMKRKKGSNIVNSIDYKFEQISKATPNESQFESITGNAFVIPYQKILIASPEQVLNLIVSRERQQLMKQLTEDKDTPEVCFIETALKHLDDRQSMLNLKNSAQEENVVDDDSANTSTNSSDNKDEYYYFYQCLDGQHIYMHNLNVRMLAQQYGDLKLCPHKITAKIIEIECSSMSLELRKRYRYMQHLPLTCEFRIVELLFDSNHLTKNILNEFREDVSRREKMRTKRERDERKRDHHIQIEEKKRLYGLYPLPKYQLNNFQQFPVYDESNDNESPPLLSTTDLPPLDNSLICSESSTSADKEDLSFAAMLRQGKTKINENAANITTVANINSNSNDQNDNEYQVPEYHYSLGDALEAALKLRSNDNQKQESSQRKSKKKNKNKIVIKI